MVLPPAPIWFAAVALLVAFILATYALTAPGEATRRQTVMNLRRGLGGVSPGVSAAPLSSRTQIQKWAYALTPPGYVRVLDRNLTRAGRPKTWPIERVLVAKVLLGSLFAALGLVLFLDSRTMAIAILAVILSLLGWFLLDVLIYNSGLKRRERIQKALPDTLDQLTIAVEAGLGFEAALAHVGRNTPGPLSDEIIRTLQDIQVGSPRRDAYRALGERAQVDDLTRFLRALIQAEQYGVSVAQVLQAQSRDMRIKRRQRAEEKALQVPVKVIFPLILFILPTLFIIVLGPVAVSAFQMFTSGVISTP